MDKFNSVLAKYIMPFSTAISKNRYLLAIRDAFMLAFPITMFASITLIIVNIPSAFKFDKFVPKGYTTFMNDFLGPVPNATMNIMAVFVAFGVAYYLAQSFKTNAVYAGAISLSSFILVMPLYTDKTANSFIPIARLGSQGMFVAIITGIIVGVLYSKLEKANFTIKMPEQVPPAIAKSFEAIVPGFVTMILFTIIRMVFSATPWGNVFDIIYKGLQAPLTNLTDSLPSTLIAVFFAQIFWWFGVHGQILVNSVIDPIWQTMALQNYKAFTAGHAVPHIISSSFMGVFPIIGGNGMTLGVIVLAIFIARSVRLKSISKMVLPASLFNISEPITFGLPVVLNPVVLIPWVIGPMIAVTIDYFVMSIGLVPRPIGVVVPWTTPVFLAGWLACNSIRGGLLQLFNVALVALIWVPFLKILDNQFLKEEEATKQEVEQQGSTQTDKDVKTNEV
ncbi:PTS sugar transporter subunit IIC [Lactiplantibacillus carotarum]|uniref:PTS sugar transporter subunit IIC n=1 Tax=Lactiplantibacillus carotarum TaxID=2993456 RepID=UPI00298EE56D|nr:PTS sugar transporter subunit IIC [Lactiplantibacillus carotarum]